MTLVTKGTVNNPNGSLASTLPCSTAMIGPIGDNPGTRRRGAGENIAANDFCYINANGDVMRCLQDQVDSATAINDVQSMYSTMSSTDMTANNVGGTFTLGYKGVYTAPLAITSNAAAVQTAIQGLSTVGAGNITVTGSFPNYVFTGASSFAGVPLESIEVESSLTSNINPSPTLYMTHTTVGQAAGTGVGGAASRVRGIAIIKYKAGQPVTLYHSVIVNYADGTLTPGADYYLSGTTPGGLDTAPLYDGQDPIAFALDTQRLYVLPLK